MSCQREVRILDTPEHLFKAAAGEFVALASQAVQRSGRFTVVLSGGSTPRTLYALLATLPSIPWDRICFFWGDERHVPADHPESNYRMAYEALLSKVPVRPENVSRIPTEEQDAPTAAARYEQLIRDFFALAPGKFPRFDLTLLGMGPDGHTASLFPNTAALNENSSRLVVANWVEKFRTHRITMTFPVLNHSAFVMFLVSGKDKGSALRQALVDHGSVPASRVCPMNGRLLWLVDRAAAASLTADQKFGT